MEGINFAHIFEKYKGLWVALTKDHQVISAEKTAKETYQEAQEKGYTDPILFKVPTEDMPFVGYPL